MSTQAQQPQFALPTIPNQKEASTLVRSTMNEAAGLAIKDEDGFIASWALVDRHDQAIRKIEEMFNPFVDGLHKLHKMAIGLRDQFLIPVKQSKNAILGARQTYRIEQERLKKIEADKQAEILRKAQAKEMEKEAKKLEKTGDVEAAQVVREQAAVMPAPVVPIAPATPKQEGSVVKKTWKFAVDNEALVPIEYRTVDESKIRKVVNALGDKASIPGVRVWQETSEHSRAIR
jgi:hypothetical protein